MAIKERGRIDWKPNLKVWRVIWYQGSRDIPVGDFPTQEDAVRSLRDKIDALQRTD
ncbi:hypothetical protein LCGC14_2784040 [marine sediment metagenome]|uniref:AP2/ERF domain-containing protein n=1 Tax=marine sediment metagenome TaxID=412755 RepID=A0A0F9BJ03_9ZZZZ